MGKKRRHYHVPEMPDADHLANLASNAIEAAREGAPDQREHANRLFRAIYGPLGPRAVMSTKVGIKRTSNGAR